MKCGVGEGIRTCGVPRGELFVVSKVAAEHKTYESAAKSIDETLEKMGLDYLDMMIIHSPQPWVEVNQSEDRYVEGNRAACRLCFVYWSYSSFLYVSPFYTDTSIELRTSLLPFWTSVASTDSLVTLSRMLVSNACPGFQFEQSDIFSI